MDENVKRFVVGSPKTIYDWAALRDEFRGKVDLLDVDPMSVLYGLSNMVEYRDDGFSHEVEFFLSRSADPIRARFDFAYLLASLFWDTYEGWCLEAFPDDQTITTRHLLPELRGRVLAWLVEGLKVHSDQMEVMDSAYYVVSRIGIYDTFLEEDDVPQLEAAADREISYRTSEGGRKIIEAVAKAWESASERKKDNQDEEA